MTTAKIIAPFPRAREIKPDGADIVEVLQCYTIEEINEHIKRSVENGRQKILDNKSNNGRRKTSKNTENFTRGIDTPTDSERCNYPFTILGIGDDNQAYFLDDTGRMRAYTLSSLNDKKLMELAGLTTWKARNGGGHPDAKAWLELIDELMHVSKNTDFDIDRLRGRGAWRTKSGDICYFDGRNITGTPDKNWVFVRRPERKIGICSPECNFETRAEIRRLCNEFTFSSDCDIVRVLAWSCLAPFGGALIWRPALMMNGESGSGKSTLLFRLINEISKPQFFDGKETTEPGIRETLGLDSYGVTIDEAEPGNEKRDRERFARILSMVRTASTDNSPKTAKGTGGRGAITYRMRSMVCLASINAAVGNVAEDNRIIRANLEERKNLDSFFTAIKRMDSLLTHQNSDGIRSFTWNNLQKIIETGHQLEYIIQKTARKTARFAAGESILLSAYMHVWENWNAESLTNEQFLTDYINAFYQGQIFDEERNETNETIQRILDEPIVVDDTREKQSIRHLLIEMKKYLDKEAGVQQPIDCNPIKYQEFMWFKKTVELYGIGIHGPTRELFISQNHHQISKIIEMGKGYHRQLMRHKNIMSYEGNINPSCKIDGVTRRGVLIGGCLDY